ncbi:MAG: ABC transporter substrate-binding protein [Epsilonproteobacteria bacterium]|nr:ABC transporter substrate-binding protein [Campylobacterota bacterium]
MFRILKKLSPFFILVLILSSIYLFFKRDEYLKDSIKLVQFAPLSGIDKDIAKEFNKGIRAYFEEVNRNGGIKGRKIEFISIDDKGRSDIALFKAEELKKDKEPFAFFATISPCTSKRILEAESDRSHPLLFPYCSLKSFDKFKNYFTILQNSESELKALVEYLKESEIKRVGIFYEEDYCFREMVERLKTLLKNTHIKIVVISSYPKNTLLVHKAYEEISKKSPKALFILSLYKGALKFLSKAKEDINFANTTFLAPSCIGMDALAKNAPLNIDLITATSIFPLRANQEIFKEYRSLMNKFYPDSELGFDSFKGYLFAKILCMGMEVSPYQLSFNTLLNSLKKIPYIMYNKEFLVKFISNDNKLNKIYLLRLKDKKFIPLQEE